MKLSWLSWALAIIFVMAIMDAPIAEAKALASPEAEADADASADASANAFADAEAEAFWGRKRYLKGNRRENRKE
uniref:Venom peptide ECTX1-Rm32a n=1 Tax=Rhytidoponera metallica TaxID=148364 RepID=A0A8U0LTI4_RHYMT|nr:venom peptide precursor ECTX1-Rm32a [Rhytidoponera metallica]